MTTATALSLPCPTLAERLWTADTRAARLLRGLTLAAVGSALLAVSAKVQLPFVPVPMTMQTFVVLVLGMVFGARLGAATVLLYLAEGAAGAPVFAHGGGLAYLAGPTGGYLAGFVAAAWLIGGLAERGFDRRRATTLLAMTGGTAVIFVVGVTRLATLVGLDAALDTGLWPLLPAAAFKIALATLLLPAVWRRVGRVGERA